MAEEQTPVTTQQPAQTAPIAPAGPTVKSFSGFDEGEVLPDGDIVKGTYDDDNNLVGWHKEPGKSEPHPVANPTGEEQPIVADPNEPAPEPPNAELPKGVA